jgi:hypothetical protein
MKISAVGNDSIHSAGRSSIGGERQRFNAARYGRAWLTSQGVNVQNTLNFVLETFVVVTLVAFVVFETIVS